MLILAVDTTTPSGAVAILDETRLMAEIAVESTSTHSSRLLASIDLLLGALRLGITDIGGFAVAPGPGSFTGIRIGLSTVKSFAFASGKPVAPVSSLLALAWKLRDSQNKLVCPMLDAKKGEIYAALYEVEGGRMKEGLAQGAYSPGDFLSRLPAHRNILFIGNGAELYRPKIQAHLKDKARFSSRSGFIAYEVGRLGGELFKAKKSVSSDRLEPLYFRISQAEEKH
jgi:tRNA threonylcarbamoyladenosine biosynthesis protein TsaB